MPHGDPKGGEPRGNLGALAGLLAWKEPDDLGVVLGGVDVVGATRRGHRVEHLRVPLEDLPGACVAFQRK